MVPDCEDYDNVPLLLGPRDFIMSSLTKFKFVPTLVMPILTGPC